MKAQEPDGAAHTTPANEEQKVVSAYILLTSYKVQDPVEGMLQPQLRWIYPHQLT